MRKRPPRPDAQPIRPSPPSNWAAPPAAAVGAPPGPATSDVGGVDIDVDVGVDEEAATVPISDVTSGAAAAGMTATLGPPPGHDGESQPWCLCDFCSFRLALLFASLFFSLIISFVVFFAVACRLTFGLELICYFCLIACARTDFRRA